MTLPITTKVSPTRAESIPTPAETPSDATPTIAVDASYQAVQLAWFYKPPDTSLEDLAENYDLFILTHNDETERQKLVSLGANVGVTFFL